MRILTFLQLADKVLQEAKRPLSASEIWATAQSKGYDKQVRSKGKTPLATLGALLYVDVRDNQASNFVAIGSRPKRFVIRSLANKFRSESIEDLQPSISVSGQQGYREKDLHPFVVHYGFYYLRAYLRTIQHSKSGKKAFGQWVHPDIVGCYFPFSDWEEEVVEASSVMGHASIKLFSFELKKELTLSNLREAFFQAVSNSSWANEGYLAAAEINGEDDFRTELKRLSTSFGIGVIRIDTEDPDATEIILPAKSKESIDWETVNKLASLNSDFQDFLKRIKIDVSSREARAEMYDRVFEKDELIKSISKKK